MNKETASPTLIFVDGSERGGFWLDERGDVHIIRPWSDEEQLAKGMRQLRAANSLLQATQTSGDSEFGQMAEKSGVSLLRAAQASLAAELTNQSFNPSTDQVREQMYLLAHKRRH